MRLRMTLATRLLPLSEFAGRAMQWFDSPLLLVTRLCRPAAVHAAGLFVVNVVAVAAYSHVLLGEGFEAALGQHFLWGYMLLVVLVFGPGRFAVDGMMRVRRP